MRTILVDGDTVAHQCAYASSDVERIAVNKVRKYMRAVRDCTAAIVCLSDPSRRYFRHAIWDGYKPDRGNDKRELIAKCKAALAGAFDTRWLPELEGDDVIGILATHPTAVPGEKVMVSCDKDMLTIPGGHYNPQYERKLIVTPEQADRVHLIQTLIGDGTDGYPGCPGVGEARVNKILPKVSDTDPEWYRRAWLNVCLAFKRAGRTEVDALHQAWLARILRATEYDLDRKEIRLWEPPAKMPDDPPASVAA